MQLNVHASGACMRVAGGCSGGFQYAAALLQGDLGLELARFKNGLEERDCSLHSSLSESSGAILSSSRGKQATTFSRRVIPLTIFYHHQNRPSGKKKTITVI